MNIFIRKQHFISWHGIADKQNIGISFPSQKQFAEVAKERDNQANLKGYFERKLKCQMYYTYNV